MLKAGLVSVVLPVYNRVRLLREAIASVEAQTYRPIEIILVDDGSTDESVGECDRQAERQPDVVRAVHRSNGGPGAARESGRALVRGEFVQYLDSDDLLLPGKFELQVAALRAREDAGVAYGLTRFRYANGSVAPGPWKGSGIARDTMFPSFLAERWWDTSNPLYRRSVTDAAGPWLPLWQEEDWEYDARIAALGTRLAFVPEFVIEYRQQAADALSNRWTKDPRRMADRCRAHSEIFAHAMRAGVAPETPEMRRFARELFLLARQAGAMGRNTEAKELFHLARKASGARRNGLDFLGYRVAAALLGWTTAGRVACVADRLRPKAASS